MIRFGEPAAFVFASLVGVLVLLYLWERWRRRVVVPSLLLWESVPEEVLRTRRFQPDPLFVLQLLILTALIVGLAQPFRGVAGDPTAARQIVVVDTTASMQTREGDRSRLDAARAAALAHLRTLPADAEVMVIAAGLAPEVVTEFTRDRTALEAALRALAASDTGGDLAVSLAVAAAARQRADRPTAVHVFTDRLDDDLPATLRDGVTVHQVGTARTNLAIGGMQVFQGPFEDPRDARLHVQVHNFSDDEVHGFLTVQLDQQIIKRVGFTIAPDDARGLVIDGFTGPGRVVASLDADDGLAADNVARAWLRPVAPVRVLLVSPLSPLIDDLRRVARATPGFQLSVADPARLDAASLADTDVAIFHRWTPAATPTVNALYIYPPPDNPVFPARGDAERVEVIDWNAQHPALASLRPLASLPLRQTRVLDPPDWSTPLLWSRNAAGAFPLALAGDVGGHRVACIAFDVEADRLLGTDNVPLLLFFMNVVAWLTPAPEDVLVAATGQVLALHDLPPGPVVVHTPHGATQTLPADRRTLELRSAGEYTMSAGGMERRVLANFFDAAESDVGRHRPPSVAVAAPPPTAGPTRGTTRAPAANSRARLWLYGLAVGLFLLEWAVRRRYAAGAMS